MLFCHDTFLTILQKIFDKKSASGAAWHTQQDGVNLTIINLLAKDFSRALISDLNKHDYTFDIVKEREVTINDKKRLLYEANLTDKIVQTYLAYILTKVLCKKIIPNCYAYIPGKNNVAALRSLANYLRRTKDQDIYVIRTDIASYTDTIPVHPKSPLWNMLSDLAKELPISAQEHEYLMSLLKSAIHPLIKTEELTYYQKYVGSPTGSPLGPLVYNLYGVDFDSQLAAIPQLFYARYCDDIILAHHDTKILLEADQLLSDLLDNHFLKRNLHKDQRTYLTRAGKAHSEDPITWRGSNKIEYLGLAINRYGNISITQKHMNRLLGTLVQRVSNCHDLLINHTLQEKCHHLCQLIKQLAHRDNEFQSTQLASLLQNCDDRRVLKQIDFFIAQIIAEKISGKKGVQAFRKISYKKLRQKYGLISLVNMKNSQKSVNNHRKNLAL